MRSYMVKRMQITEPPSASSPPVAKPHALEPAAGVARRVSPARLFLVFLKIGLLSFGGGSSTIALMDRELVQRRGWLDREQFVLTIALSKINPGVNILAQTVMIGGLLGGPAGAFVALAALLLPATTLTILLSAGYVAVHNQPDAQAALRGILAATAGMALSLAYWLGWEQTRLSRGRTLLADLGIIAASFFLLLVVQVHVLVVILVFGLLGLLRGPLRVPPASMAAEPGLLRRTPEGVEE
jgi:chromate transporter